MFYTTETKTTQRCICQCKNFKTVCSKHIFSVSQLYLSFNITESIRLHTDIAYLHTL